MLAGSISLSEMSAMRRKRTFESEAAKAEPNVQLDRLALIGRRHTGTD